MLKVDLSLIDGCHLAGGGLFPMPSLSMSALQLAMWKNWPEGGSRACQGAAPGPDPVVPFFPKDCHSDFCGSELFGSVLMIPL